MRSAQLVGGLVGVLALAWTVQAAPVVLEYEDRTITSPEVEVRSGPSMDPKFYPTSKLHQGDVVKVVRNKPVQNGWLAIKPPTGSFSWVNATLIKPVDAHTGVVQAEDTPVLIGSGLTNSPPSVRGPAPLPRGATVVLLDKELVASDGSKWWPIEPHPTEVRYIPASAVERNSLVHAVASQKPALDLNAPAPSSDIQDPLFQQAEQKETAGKVAEAEQLYKRLADTTRDHQVKLICQNRLTRLKQAAPPAAPANVQLGNPAPANGPQVSLTGQVVPTPANQATALYGNPPANAWSQPGSSPAPAAQAAQWSGPGWLRPAAFNVDGKQVYALSNYTGQHLYYVLAQPGVPLEQYVNRNVNLYGSVSYRGETVRANFLTASQVQLLP